MPAAELDRARWESTQTILLDIEGTISSISFVKDVLYPYALNRLASLARNSWSDASFQELITSFPEETKTDPDTLIAHVEDLTRRDIKAVYLKQLQGKLWQTGYSTGDLKTPLFPDVIPVLNAWKSSGKTLAIFSSGSVQAQLQFFSYVKVKDGETETTRDIKPLFSAHFDTVSAGSKLEANSYAKLCKELGEETERVSFLTDNVAEAIAATEAGIYSIVVDRPGNAPLSEDSKARFKVIENLAELP